MPQDVQIGNRPLLSDRICPGLWKEGLREARLVRKLLSTQGQELVQTGDLSHSRAEQEGKTGK